MSKANASPDTNVTGQTNGGRRTARRVPASPSPDRNAGEGTSERDAARAEHEELGRHREILTTARTDLAARQEALDSVKADLKQAGTEMKASQHECSRANAAQRAAQADLERERRAMAAVQSELDSTRVEVARQGEMAEKAQFAPEAEQRSRAKAEQTLQKDRTEAAAAAQRHCGETAGHGSRPGSTETDRDRFRAEAESATRSLEQRVSELAKLTRGETIVQDNPEMDASIIWVTGYSASGKTTVGRKVDSKLRERGVRTVFLDGDDLRAILAGRWGYSREERTDLGRVYFRLSNHLASQGVTVVISAVAMYDEVREWVREKLGNCIEAYLRVPDEERRRRDAETKGIYDKMGDVTVLYDEPNDPDLCIDNYGNATPDSSAETIVERYFSVTERHADRGRTAHWEDFYSRNRGVLEASPFAEFVGSKISKFSEIIEIGCGNGRDSAYFARSGHNVVGVDTSEEAIKLCREAHSNSGIVFCSGSMKDLLLNSMSITDYIYCRFVLHAMTLEEEVQTLNSSFKLLRARGELFIECRSINDPLAREGEILSPTERVAGHYRRFIIMEELKKRVENAGFKILECFEGKGMAIFGNEDPVVVRLRGQKP